MPGTPFLWWLPPLLHVFAQLLPSQRGLTTLSKIPTCTPAPHTWSLIAWYKNQCFSVMFIVYGLSLHMLHEGRNLCQFCSAIYPKQCLAHRRYSVNICWMNEQYLNFNDYSPCASYYTKYLMSFLLDFGIWGTNIFPTSKTKKLRG